MTQERIERIVVLIRRTQLDNIIRNEKQENIKNVCVAPQQNNGEKNTKQEKKMWNDGRGAFFLGGAH